MLVLICLAAIVSVSALMITAIIVSERNAVEAERARADKLESIVRRTVGPTEDLLPRRRSVPTARTRKRGPIDPHFGDGS